MVYRLGLKPGGRLAVASGVDDARDEVNQGKRDREERLRELTPAKRGVVDRERASGERAAVGERVVDEVQHQRSFGRETGTVGAVRMLRPLLFDAEREPSARATQERHLLSSKG